MASHAITTMRCGVRGHERANSLAVRARKMQSINLENVKPFGAKRSELKIRTGNAHNTIWNSATVGKTSKIWWGKPISTGHLSVQANLHKTGAAEVPMSPASFRN